MENQKIKKLSELRNEKIYKEFEMLFNEKGLRIDIIYKRLSLIYYLSVSRIGKIVVEEAKKIRAKKRLSN